MDSGNILSELKLRRERAYKAFEARSDAILRATDCLPEDEHEVTEMRDRVERLDARIREERALEKQRAELDVGRAELRAAGRVAVTGEERVYSKESRSSFYGDLMHSAFPGYPGYEEARSRLQRHAYESAKEMVSGSREGRQVERQVRELTRSEDPLEHRSRFEQFAAFGQSEFRAATTSTMQVVPAYLKEWAPYREAGRTFANILNKQPLPEYGMTVYLPKVESPAEVETQGTENTGIAETDPTAGFLSAAVLTPAGQVTISQQWIDRVGYGPGFDKQVSDALARDYSPKVDKIALTAALAGAGSIAYTDSSFNVTKAGGGGPSFYSAVANAEQTIRTAAGTFANPSALVLTPFRWAAICEAADTTGRPLIVPASAGFNPAAEGDFAKGDDGIEGQVGFNMLGCEVYQDFNIPAPTTGHDQAIVLDPLLTYWLESDPVDRSLPQTKGDALSVLIQRYGYCCGLPIYPLATQTISGTGMASSL